MLNLLVLYLLVYPLKLKRVEDEEGLKKDEEEEGLKR